MSLCFLVSELTKVSQLSAGPGVQNTQCVFFKSLLMLFPCLVLSSQVLVCLMTLKDLSQMLLPLEPSGTLPGGLCPLYSCMYW